MNNNAYISGAYGPTAPGDWQPIGAADFNTDGRLDYVLCITAARQTAIWYLNGASVLDTAAGPTVASGWTLTEP
jgi:hypothetical protein